MTFLVTSLVVFWTPAAIILAFYIVLSFFLIKEKKIFLSKPLLFLFLTLGVVHGPWMVLFVKASRVSSFISNSPSSQVKPENKQHFRFSHSEIDAKRGLKYLSDYAVGANPLIFSFFPTTLYLLLRRKKSLPLALTLITLLGIGTLTVSVMPQLELDRMLIVWGICLTPLIAKTANLVLRKKNIYSLITYGILLTTPFLAASVARNRTPEQYIVRSSNFDSLANLINAIDGDSRVVFLGCVIHEFSESHLAPLSLLVHHPLVASSPFHTLWHYKQIVPAEFMANKEDGIENYLDFMNTGGVIVHEKEWKEYVRAKPTIYHELGKVGDFIVFFTFQRTWLLFRRRGSSTTIRKLSYCYPKYKKSTLRFSFLPLLKSSSGILGEK